MNVVRPSDQLPRRVVGVHAVAPPVVQHLVAERRVADERQAQHVDAEVGQRRHAEAGGRRARDDAELAVRIGPDPAFVQCAGSARRRRGIAARGRRSPGEAACAARSSRPPAPVNVALHDAVGARHQVDAGSGCCESVGLRGGARPRRGPMRTPGDDGRCALRACRSKRVAARARRSNTGCQAPRPAGTCRAAP